MRLYSDSGGGGTYSVSTPVSSGAQASAPLQMASVPVPAPILKLGGAGINDYNIDQRVSLTPSGTYDLVYATTEKVFC